MWTHWGMSVTFASYLGYVKFLLYHLSFEMEIGFVGID